MPGAPGRRSQRAGGELPSVLRESLNDLFWCDEAQEYVEVEGPERVAVRPIEGLWL